MKGPGSVGQGDGVLADQLCGVASVPDVQEDGARARNPRQLKREDRTGDVGNR